MLLELRQSTKELERSEIARELDAKFERLYNIMQSLSDFIGQDTRAWYIRFVEPDEIEVSHIYEREIATYVRGDLAARLTDIYDRFFGEKVFVNKIMMIMVRTVSEIVDLIKRNSDVYTKIGELDGKIDQLYREIKKSCTQQDP
jgi:hypothetical protein